MELGALYIKGYGGIISSYNVIGDFMQTYEEF